MKFNLRTKLIGGYVVIVLLMAFAGLEVMYTSKTIKGHLENIVRRDVKQANILGDVGRGVGFIRSNFLLHLLSKSIDDMYRYESEVADWLGNINTDLDTLEKMLEDQVALDKLAEFRAVWDTYLRFWKEQAVPLSRANRDEEAFELARKRGAAGTAAREAMYKLDELHEATHAEANNSMKLSEQTFRKSQYVSLAFALFAIIIGLFFGIIQNSFIAGPVNAVSKAAQLVAAGDLDQVVEVKTGDEIESMADSFNIMTGKLKKMVEELRHEITERKRAEDQLRESEQWLSTTLRSIGDAVIATDAKGLVTLMNSVAEDLTGWDEAETVGRPLEDVFNIINEQTEERAENPVARVLREGVIVGLANHTVLIARDGTKRTIADSGAPIRDEQGNIIGTVMVFRDITSLSQIEAQLRQTQKLEAVGQLAGGVAHDFNTLLGTILGYGDMMRDHIPEGSRPRDYLEKLIMAGYRSKELVRQLMDFAHPTKEGYKPEWLDLILEESLRLLRASLPSTINIRENIEAGSGTVLANSSQIQQVIMNLGMNAGDAMGDKGGELEVSLAEAEVDAKLASLEDVQEGIYLRLTVRDTGCGVEQEIMERIFEPFFTTKDVGKGYGLGLSVVHGIVKSHGGFIKVDSGPGKGSLFHVYLPKIQ